MMLMDIGLMEDDYAPVNGIRIIQDMKGAIYHPNNLFHSH